MSEMPHAFLVGGARTPVGRYGGALSSVRPDDLAALCIRSVVEDSGIDPSLVDEVILGNANGAGEENRNVARMSLLLAGLPLEVTGTTINRLCGSGMDAVILPTVASLPPLVEKVANDADNFVAENILALRNTRFANVLGLPAVTLPTRFGGYKIE